MMTPEEWADREYERRAEGYLDGLHTAMWGRAFDLYQTESKENAVKFLADAFKEMLK